MIRMRPDFLFLMRAEAEAIREAFRLSHNPSSEWNTTRGSFVHMPKGLK